MAIIVRSVKKILIGLIGFPVLLLGIVLIPLPGPGLLISFVGFLILSREFEWAGRQVDRIKTEIKKLIKKPSILLSISAIDKINPPVHNVVVDKSIGGYSGGSRH